MKAIFLLLALFVCHLPSLFSQNLTAADFDFGFKSFNQGQSFTAIAADPFSGRIWAGTDENGVYNLNTIVGLPANFSVFTNSASDGPDLSSIDINSIAADKLGNVWIGHEGVNFSGGAGGMEKIDANLNVTHFSPDRNALGFTFFARDGLGTLKVTSVTTDMNNTVWAAQRSHNLTSGSTFILTPGTISNKKMNSSIFTSRSVWWDPLTGQGNSQTPDLPYPAHTFNPSFSVTPQSRNMQAISADSSQVVVGVWGYTPKDNTSTFIPPRLLRYDLNGNSTSPFISPNYPGESFIDMNLPAGGIINGVCTNDSKGIWVTTSVTGRGFTVFYNGSWHYMDPNDTQSSIDKIIPPGTRFNTNAIWKNAYGNVFMGTNKGLLVYNGRTPANQARSYTFYSGSDQFGGSIYQVVDPDMVSNNIQAGTSQFDSIQWMATDNGIMRSKIGFTPVIPGVAICPQLWRDRTSFTDLPPPQQCTTSQDISASQDVIDVELAISNRQSNPTYHIYQIETDLGTSDSSKYLTVENVFNVIKDRAQYQALLPSDFPVEVLGDLYLERISDEDVSTFAEIVDTKTSRISSIQRIINQNSSMFESNGDVTNPNWRTVFGLKFQVYVDENQPLDTYLSEQLSVNPTKSIHETEVYKLYNTPPASKSRSLFKSNYTEAPLFFTPIKEEFTCDGPGITDFKYDPVIMHIDETNYTITNYTLEGHFFHPGKVTRTVLRDDFTGEIYIRTIGEGLHFCNGTLGEFSGKLNTIMGTVLFKNVDLRLKDALNTLQN